MHDVVYLTDFALGTAFICVQLHVQVYRKCRSIILLWVSGNNVVAGNSTRYSD